MSPGTALFITSSLKLLAEVSVDVLDVQQRTANGETISDEELAELRKKTDAAIDAWRNG